MKRFLLLLPLLFPFSALAQGWNDPTSKTFATALARGNSGDWWIGADDQGLYRWTPTSTGTPFITPEELGDKNVTCIAVDPAHRVWVGTASAGVTVFNSETWKRYSIWNGPLSNRINALKVDPSGAVWGATDAGLFRWSEKDGWQYPGIFSNEAVTRDTARRPVYALAFESPTSVLVATDDGVNRVTLVDDQPRIAPIGRATSRIQPPSAQGVGFLPGPVHDVAFDSEKQIWCATRYGVSISKDAGKSWQFLRGADWSANVKGSAVSLTPGRTNQRDTDELLAEDWVTTLAPTTDGRMWLGFRQKGAEERDCRTRELIVSTRDDPKSATQPTFGGDWVTSIVPLGDDTAAFTRYGGGVATLFGVNLPMPKENGEWPKTSLPDDAKLPEQLLAQLAHDLDERAPLNAGEGVFYGLDRETRGDWPLRYGNEGGEIMAVEDPKARLVTEPFTLGNSYAPHRAGEDADLFVYIHELSNDNPNTLQMPWKGIRRQAEENDGSWQGGKYPYSFDGPDMWKHFSVPEGLHRVSLYWYNKDGHSGENRMRDHRVELFPATLSPTECLTHEPLAKARLWSGWNGEYVSFAVRGPAEYRIRMARDRSKGTILQAVFFDRLGTPQPKPSWLPDSLQMPPSPQIQTLDNPIFALWQACDKAETRGVPCLVERTLALRTANASGAPKDLLAAWRVQAGLWDEAGIDRQTLALEPPPKK